MKVNIAIERSLVVPVPLKKATTLLQDLEGTLSRFPKLKKLSRIGDNCYRWDMQRIGSRIANISHEVVYGARYKVDTKKGEISWTAMPEQGNAKIEGRFGITSEGERTRLTFKVYGELRDVPVTLLYRAIAPAFIQGQFNALVETFLERTGEALGVAPAVSASSKRVKS